MCFFKQVFQHILQRRQHVFCAMIFKQKMKQQCRMLTSKESHSLWPKKRALLCFILTEWDKGRFAEKRHIFLSKRGLDILQRKDNIKFEPADPRFQHLKFPCFTKKEARFYPKRGHVFCIRMHASSRGKAYIMTMFFV